MRGSRRSARACPTPEKPFPSLSRRRHGGGGGGKPEALQTIPDFHSGTVGRRKPRCPSLRAPLAPAEPPDGRLFFSIIRPTGHAGVASPARGSYCFGVGQRGDVLKTTKEKTGHSLYLRNLLNTIAIRGEYLTIGVVLFPQNEDGRALGAKVSGLGSLIRNGPRAASACIGSTLGRRLPAGDKDAAAIGANRPANGRVLLPFPKNES